MRTDLTHLCARCGTRQAEMDKCRACFANLYDLTDEKERTHAQRTLRDAKVAQDLNRLRAQTKAAKGALAKFLLGAAMFSIFPAGPFALKLYLGGMSFAKSFGLSFLAVWGVVASVVGLIHRLSPRRMVSRKTAHQMDVEAEIIRSRVYAAMSIGSASPADSTKTIRGRVVRGDAWLDAFGEQEAVAIGVLGSSDTGDVAEAMAQPFFVETSDGIRYRVDIEHLAIEGSTRETEGECGENEEAFLKSRGLVRPQVTEVIAIREGDSVEVLGFEETVVESTAGYRGEVDRRLRGNGASPVVLRSLTSAKSTVRTRVGETEALDDTNDDHAQEQEVIDHNLAPSRHRRDPNE